MIESVGWLCVSSDYRIGTVFPLELSRCPESIN